MDRQRKQVFSFSDSELSLVIGAVNAFRNLLLQGEKPTEDIDTLMQRLSRKKESFSFDSFECGLLTNAVFAYREQLGVGGESTHVVDDILRRVLLSVRQAEHTEVR